MININVTNDKLVNAIKAAIKDKKPLSVVRCGDGEMHILKNETDFNKPQHVMTHRHALCSIQFRENLWQCKIHRPSIKDGRMSHQTCNCYLKDKRAVKWRKMSRNIISYAIKNSDYVGLVVPGRLTQYYSIDENVLARYRIVKNNLNVISSLFPLDPIFGDLESFKDIIQGQDIHIITPNVNNFKKAKIDELLGVNVTYTDISHDMAHNLRDDVHESIKNTKAQIVLFGGGYAIKDFIPKAASMYKKVAIDVGSVLDAWSGYQSRKMFLDKSLKHLTWV